MFLNLLEIMKTCMFVNSGIIPITNVLCLEKSADSVYLEITDKRISLERGKDMLMNRLFAMA